VLIKLLDLPAHARSALVTSHIDQTATADFGPLGQQPARAASKGGFLFRSQVQQRDQQIGRHTHESMHVQFLIGPVKLCRVERACGDLSNRYPNRGHDGIVQFLASNVQLIRSNRLILTLR